MKQLTLKSPITDIAGIGSVRAAAFARLGIFSVRDLLYHFPRAYENRGDISPLSDARDGEVHAFTLVVATAPKTARLRRNMSVTKFRAFDETATAEVTFFNQPYTASLFAVGDEYRFFGKVTVGRKLISLTNPAYERIAPDMRLADYVPRYPLADGLSTKLIATAIEEALPCLFELKDFLPENIRAKYGFLTLENAIKTLHSPANSSLLRPAFDRLAFDEYFLFSLGLSLSRRAAKKAASALPCTKQNISPLLSLLPYQLTEGQKKAIREIAADMTRSDRVPMSRILVGDVGCGKTICAAAATYIALLNNHQAVIMAPTEILARQHFKELSALFVPLGYSVSLLLGSTPKKDKEAIYAAVAEKGNGRCDLLIGTHALLNERLHFADLALAVTDEQHRFGVAQRTAIRQSAPHAHLLVMSATPIPRTLALVLYGDLDISRIEEMPFGRQRVETYLIQEALRPRLHTFIRKAVEEGGQVYIVCPAIEEEDEGAVPLGHIFLPEEKEKLTVKTTLAYAEELSTVFPEYAVAYLHGRMKPAEKDAVMSRFAEGKLDILVSTTVIEVGVNVPNASLMIVENAERFGLSQLHQLRGRVGRGNRKSYCVLVSDAQGGTAKQRLTALTKTYDGYEIAEEDLRLRGPGDFFAMREDAALRQRAGLRFSPIAEAADKGILTAAFEEAASLLAKDEHLSSCENQLLAEEINRLFTPPQNTFS